MGRDGFNWEWGGRGGLESSVIYTPQNWLISTFSPLSCFLSHRRSAGHRLLKEWVRQRGSEQRWWPRRKVSVPGIGFLWQG